MKKAIYIGSAVVLIIFAYFPMKGECFVLDEDVSWVNVDGTMIKITTKDKVVSVGLDIYLTEYRVSDSSNIVFEKDEMCVGDSISIDGRRSKIKNICVLDRKNFSKTDEKTERDL